MNNKLLRPGSIVCAHYNAFQGDDRVGLFCILYDEQLDSSNNYKNNVVALKVTTNLRMANTYVVSANDGRNDFFEQDCLVCCSKVHIIDKEQIYKIVGTLHSSTLKNVYKVYRQFEREIERQVEDYF